MASTPTKSASPHAAPRKATGAPSSALANSGARGASLYELGTQAQEIAGELAIAAALLDSDDESERETAITLIESYLDKQDQNTRALLSKADNVCYYIDHLEAQAKFRREQAARLEALADADARRAETFKKTLTYVLTRLQPGQTRFSLPTHELRSRTTESISVIDESLIPEELLRVKTTTAPDKAAIKAAIKSGAEVPGAELVKNTSWSIK